MSNTTTTIHINSLDVLAHDGFAPATFSVTRQPIAGNVNASDVFKYFYTCNGGEQPTSVSSQSVNVAGDVGSHVYGVKCGLFNDHWALLPMLFASASECQQWLDNASEETLESLMPYSDLSDGMEYSANWTISVLPIEIDATGWSEWSDD